MVRMARLAVLTACALAVMIHPFFFLTSSLVQFGPFSQTIRRAPAASERTSAQGDKFTGQMSSIIVADDEVSALQAIVSSEHAGVAEARHVWEGARAVRSDDIAGAKDMAHIEWERYRVWESRSTVVGGLLTILGSTIINLGTILMKKGVLLPKDLTPSAARSCSCMWYIGVLLFLFGNIFNFASLSMANLSLLSSIGSVQFVTNVIFSRYILGEPVTQRTLAGTVIIIVGDVTVALASPKQSDKFNAAQLKDRYTDTTYLSYVGLLMALTALCQYVYCQRKLAGRQGGLLSTLSFALASALFGTQSSLQGKCLSTLISELPNDRDREVMAENFAFCVAVLVLWFFATWWWMRRMTMALRSFPATIIPILQVFWIVVSILNGMFYFKESAYMTFGSRLGFIFGMLVVVLGVAVLASPDDAWRLRGDDHGGYREMTTVLDLK